MSYFVEDSYATLSNLWHLLKLTMCSKQQDSRTIQLSTICKFREKIILNFDSNLYEMDLNTHNIRASH